MQTLEKEGLRTSSEFIQQLVCNAHGHDLRALEVDGEEIVLCVKCGKSLDDIRTERIFA